MGTTIGCGIVGKIIDVRKNIKFGMGFEYGMMIGLVLGFANVFLGVIINENNPEVIENYKKQNDMKNIMFKEFDCLGMSEGKKAKILITKCGYASKNAYRDIRRQKVISN